MDDLDLDALRAKLRNDPCVQVVRLADLNDMYLTHLVQMFRDGTADAVRAAAKAA